MGRGMQTKPHARHIPHGLKGLHRDLDFAVVSHEINSAKPDAPIFEAAARRASAAARLLHDAALPPIAPDQAGG